MTSNQLVLSILSRRRLEAFPLWIIIIVNLLAQDNIQREFFFITF